MKKFTRTVSGIICLMVLITTSAFAQIPADQKVVIIDPGTGTLETAINGDVDGSGNRVNPNRVYQLKKDGIYIMNSPILFGSATAIDSTATLIIVGEPGGKKPVILMDPLAGGNAFTNIVHASLTIKNVYWPALALNNTGASLFQLFRSNERLILQDVVTESCTNGDLFNLEQVRGTMDIYFKNCYFRDNTQFTNPWNFATFARGNGAQAIDTLWIENTTVGNAGLTFFGKGCPINFTFFDHNTIINVAKYVFFFEQYKEAYFTNNIFINCNWQGEDYNMGKTQLESQSSSGSGNPPVYVGVLNLMEMNVNAWTLGHGSVPKMEDVKWMASNNVHFTSPFLNKYQTGGYGDGKPYPVSYLDWGVLPAGTTFPLEVKNVPPMFMSAKTQQLVDQYPGIVAESNLIQVDPKMKTPGIADQAEGDLYAQWARSNFAIAGVALPDDATFSFGDQDPTTIPGIKSENGAGFRTVNDLLEDFSYTEAISSKIDSKHLGSLAWYPTELAAYDGNAALANIKAYYQSQVNKENQKVVIVEPGTGTLETAINSDVDANGNRNDPTRVYQLKKDGIYIMNSPILFGSATAIDSTATLIIVGETGGKKPVILMDPLAGGNAFTNVVHASLTIKNVYWPDQALNNTGASLFQLFRSNERLILEDVVTESVTNGDLFNLEQVRGTMDIYFKNCYFRDNTQFTNPWNFATFARGNGAQAIDTLWIENTTVGNAGLTFFGKGCPINFTFFDHNTIINVAKYVFFFEQYKEAYFTNNIFINCNWQGEDYNMGKTQLESQSSSGSGNPPVYVGVLNLMEMNANAWTLGHGSVPKMEDVKWMASNNLHFTSPFLNKYQTGGYGDGKPYPVSYLDWGVLPAGTTFPLEVKNVPPMFMSEKTQQLVDQYAGIVAESNLIQVDPMMVTPGIADQAEGDLYAQWARSNFAVAGVALPDDATFSFGDQDPTTIPGIETENGAGFRTVNDLLEDFSYTAAISSKIDSKHLGSLAWYPSELATYNGKAALAAVKSYYDTKAVLVNAATTVWNPAANPTSRTGLWSENNNWTDKVSPKDNKVVFNVPDAHECVLTVPTTIKQIVMADGGPGGTLRIANGGSLTTTSGWSGIGWTGEATMIVETGGTVTFAEHMWVGWEPGSKGTVMLEGGTINVTAMFGMNFENKGGIGAVYVKSGLLKLANLAYPNSIRDGSVLDITGGTVTIEGDKVTMVNNYALAGKITADGGAGTVSAVFADGKTTITALHTGIRDNKAASVKVYPNPTHGILNVDNPSTGSFDYEIISVTGKVVSSKFGISGKTTKIDMSGLTNGMYVISIISEGKSIKQKVILK